MVTVITSTMTTNSPLITMMYCGEDETDDTYKVGVVVLVVIIVAGELEDGIGIVEGIGVSSIEVLMSVVTCTVKVKIISPCSNT